MKSAVAVALILGGVVLVGLPPVADYLWQYSVARLVEVRAGTIEKMGLRDDFYRTICVSAGLGMIVVAVVASLIRRDGP